MPVPVPLSERTPNTVQGRVYVVWVVPGHSGLTGLHAGPNAYAGLVERFPGKKYTTGSGVRFCSAKTFGEGLGTYTDEWASKRGPWPPPVFWWA